jgi:hypothetical protein
MGDKCDSCIHFLLLPYRRHTLLTVIYCLTGCRAEAQWPSWGLGLGLTRFTPSFGQPELWPGGLEETLSPGSSCGSNSVSHNHGTDVSGCHSGILLRSSEPYPNSLVMTFLSLFSQQYLVKSFSRLSLWHLFLLHFFLLGCQLENAFKDLSD